MCPQCMRGPVDHLTHDLCVGGVSVVRDPRTLSDLGWGADLESAGEFLELAPRGFPRAVVWLW